MLEVVQALALAVIISVIVNVFVVQVTEVRQRSMEPTLLQGDRVLLSKIDYRLHRPSVGDVVVFQPTNDVQPSSGSPIPFVKRVVAIAGDSVDIRDGVLFVNGQPSVVTEAHGVTAPESPAITYPLVVPADSYFALGDNRASSQDSRSFGPQSYANIIGKVLVRFWPPDRTQLFGW